MPVSGKTIAITVTNGTAGERVTAQNLTRSSPIVSAALNSSKQASLNTANSGVTWAAGDSVLVSISGRINQCSQITLSGGGTSLTLSNSANTSSTYPGVSL